ncbi:MULTISPECIES: helix-turn-helix domain-containing protein [Xanthomonas]|uniref:AraC family transcriptional regulator n=1 Tax=Xanthomonas cucurbitae TaxID=56453 RepID=A0A2S7DTL3_9XANT|nr:helix-turn-helix domain-containing protein [Xanthomonas cucurbitae]PPU77110.1 AraC family transcriptional regulator [Xanthomonas cucurbitae]QHG85884.1 helix-turn-helix domain-containing protein [Xanthomonas cucurbitae]WDM67355.1 helix-turn-helix domain-containing protein [Xanthomonas cucurbitae]WDM71232.1 helix-turn-helix domain-containing protein [Xanthomonas cucurbitae]WDM75788.1 helix-turn-helix domain-containing protein [Xanthomonas cucurbitae]
MPTRPPRSTSSVAVPAYGLYGEHRCDPPEWLHWESIAARSRLHDWRIVPHRHAALAQLLYLQRGPATLQLDGRTQRLRGATVVWLPPLCVHGFAFGPRVRGHVITLCMPLVRHALGAAPLLERAMTAPAVVQVTQARGLLDALFASVASDHAHQRIGYEAAVQAAAAQLLIWTARAVLEDAHATNAEGPQGDPALRHLRGYQALIDQHYRMHWPMSKYADQLGVTPGHLNALCKRLTGASALELLQRRIMLEARRSLRYTSLSVQQIAAALGFFDAAYFSRYFTRHAGCSPTRFRAGD